MAQVSSVDAELTPGELESDHTEDNKRKSLLHTVKDKAKGTVRKLKDKVKKSSVDSDERSSSPTGVGSDEEVEESSSGSQKALPTDAPGEARTASPHAGTEKLNGAEPREASVGDTDENMLSPFARSGDSENSPLVAVPTSYSDSTSGSVDAVMPSPVIEPASVSDVGEESSTNLGEIPEAKEEEKAAVREVNEGGPDSDINPGLKNTFKQKDLQAIDGLPKPRGFDINNESSVNSADLRGMLSQDMTDQLDTSQEVNPSTNELSKQTNRELPSGDAQTMALEEDKDHPHPPASTTDFSDSMFSSSAIQDINRNEPTIGEAKRAEMIGTFSRDLEAGADSSREKHAGFAEPERLPTSTAERCRDFEPENFESSETGTDDKTVEDSGATSGSAIAATAAAATGAVATASTAGLSHDPELLKDKSGEKDSDVGRAHDAEAIPSLDGERDRGNEFTRSLERNSCELSRGIDSEKDPLTRKDPGVQSFQEPCSSATEFPQGLDPEKEASGGKETNLEVVQGPSESTTESARDLEDLSVQDKDPENVAPASTTDLHDNVFSSAATNDLNLSRPTPTEFAKESTGIDTVREGDAEEIATFHEASKDLPPMTPEAESAQHSSSRAILSDQVPPERAITREKSAAVDDPESYFDALDEDPVANPKGVDSETGKSKASDPLDAYKKESAPSPEADESGTGVEIPKENVPLQNAGVESPSPGTLTSAIKSMVGSVGSRLGIGSAPPQGASDQ